MVAEEKTRVWDGEGLSVGLKDVLANHSMTREENAGPGPGRVRQGRGNTDSDLGYGWVVEGTPESNQHVL